MILSVALAIALLLPLSVSASSGLKSIEVYPNTINIIVNGQSVAADNFLYNNTTYIPLRAVAELLGAEVAWDGNTMTAIIKMPVATVSNDSYTLPLHLYSNDRKTYLGKLVTDEMDPDGLWYKFYGDYSSKFSSLSIWNTVGIYGSSVSTQSAFCKIATEPPIIVDNEGAFVMYLTVNEYKLPACDPNLLKQVLINIGQ